MSSNVNENTATYTSADVARILGVSKNTVIRWIKERKLHAVKDMHSLGQGYVIFQEDLDRLAQSMPQFRKRLQMQTRS